MVAGYAQADGCWQRTGLMVAPDGCWLRTGQWLLAKHRPMVAGNAQA